MRCDKSETQQSSPELYEILCCLLCGCCRFKCLEELSDVEFIGEMLKGPSFRGSRSCTETKMQSASCQKGGREVTGRCSCLQE